MKFWTLWSLFILGCVGVTAWIFYSAVEQQDREWKPSLKLATRVDTLVMKFDPPPDYPRIVSYGRYYWGVKRDGRRYVEGIAVARELAASSDPGVHVVPRKKAPFIGDGACDEINVEFDVRADRLIKGYCNPALRYPNMPRDDSFLSLIALGK